MCGVAGYECPPRFERGRSDDQVGIRMRPAALATDRPEVGCPIENGIGDRKHQRVLAKDIEPS
jgi:hypothetical protein